MTAPALRRLRILVVDDEDLIRAAIKMMLQSDGHLVDTAASGEDALSIFASGMFDLVMTDYAMAGMKGTELAAAIKNRAAECPVVMITAYAEMLPPTLPHVDCIVSKPYSRESLREAIARVR
jgi:CheY-like chemotaxis protein